MQMKHGCKGIGFTLQNLVLLVVEAKHLKGLHQKVLHNGQLNNLVVLLEKVLKR